MAHRVVASITYQNQIFPPETPEIAVYRVALLDVTGAVVASQDFAPPGPFIVTFDAPPPGPGYTVRADQRDASGVVIDGAVVSPPFSVGADVTLVVVSGVSVSVVVAG